MLLFCKTFRIFIIFFAILWLAAPAVSQGTDTIDLSNGNLEAQVQETYDFKGLANYYEAVSYFYYSDGKLKKFKEGTLTLKPDDEFAAIGRLDIAVITGIDAVITLKDGIAVFTFPAGRSQMANLTRTRKDTVGVEAPNFKGTRYSHLWKPLSLLAQAIDFSLVKIQAITGLGWAFTVILFGILLKLLLVPVNLFVVRAQRMVSSTQAALEPRLEEIKKTLKGEEAHNAFIGAHKDLNVSTFYSLKPLVGSLVQVPILIAVFNALGEMPQFREQSFMWIKDIAYPDSIASLNMSIPMMGTEISVLPILMTVITIGSTIIFRNKLASPKEVKRQKRNLYFMAAAFFVLFYPFPAIMVLYWTLANILQLIQQQIVKI